MEPQINADERRLTNSSPSVPIRDHPRLNSPRTFLRLLSALAVALILLSIVYRFLWLNNTPALNADEPYPIVQLMNALDGRWHSVSSPHGQFFNPIMMATELLTLLPRKPSIFLLRVPAAITGVITLACFAWLGRRVLRTRYQILFATLLLAAMPMSIAFSRIQWDTSYLPLLECFVLFPALDLAAGNPSRRSLALIVGFTFLGLWTHATFALLLVCLGAGLIFVRRRLILSTAAKWLSVRPGPILALAIVFVPAIVAIGGFIFLINFTGHNVGDVVSNSVQTAGRYLTSPSDFLIYNSRIGDAVSGVSVYEDIPGLPISSALHAFSWLIIMLLALAVLILARSPHPQDRVLAVFWTAVPFTLIATAYVLSIDQVGVERYAIWLLVPAAVTLASFAAVCLESHLQPDLACALLTLPLSAVMLYQFVPDYFLPIRHLTYRQNTYPAYWSADTDPKTTAADWIRKHAPPHSTIYAENWWINFPLQYDLGLDWTVTQDPLPNSLPKGPIVVTCFVNSGPYTGIDKDYFDKVLARLTAAGRKPTTHKIPAADGKDAVAVIIAPAK